MEREQFRAMWADIFRIASEIERYQPNRQTVDQNCASAMSIVQKMQTLAATYGGENTARIIEAFANMMSDRDEQYLHGDEK